jgi:hypothetical protein
METSQNFLLNRRTVAKFKFPFVWELLKAKCLHNWAKKWRISGRCVFFSCQYDITPAELHILIVGPGILCWVWEDHQMLKGVGNFYYTFQILPRHVSTSSCHLQRDTRVVKATLARLCFGLMWIMFRPVWPGSWQHRTNHNLQQPEAQRYWSSL